jgi:hypothetical protein
VIVSAQHRGQGGRILKSEGKAMKAEDAADQQPTHRIVQAQPGAGTRTQPGGRPGNGPVQA